MNAQGELQDGWATWEARSLQTLHAVPEVSTAARTSVGTVRGEHSVAGLTALPWGPGDKVLGSQTAPSFPLNHLLPEPFSMSQCCPLQAGSGVTWTGPQVAALGLSPRPATAFSRGAPCLSPAQPEPPTAGYLASTPGPPKAPLAWIWEENTETSAQVPHPLKSWVPPLETLVLPVSPLLSSFFCHC